MIILYHTSLKYPTQTDSDIEYKGEINNTSHREDEYLLTFLMNWGRLQMVGKHGAGREFQSEAVWVKKLEGYHLTVCAIAGTETA